MRTESAVIPAEVLSVLEQHGTVDMYRDLLKEKANLSARESAAQDEKAKTVIAHARRGVETSLHHLALGWDGETCLAKGCQCQTTPESIICPACRQKAENLQTTVTLKVLRAVAA